MIKQFIRSFSPQFRRAHAQEAAVWQSAANEGIHHLSEEPDAQQTLSATLENAQFIHGTSRYVTLLALSQAHRDSLAIVTTLSLGEFRDTTSHSSGEDHKDIGGAFSYVPATNVGVITLPPHSAFSELDRAMLFSHELSHAAWARRRSRTQKEIRLCDGLLSDPTSDEVVAYSINNQQLLNAAAAPYSALLDEVFDKMGELYTRENSVGMTQSAGHIAIEGRAAREAETLSRLAVPTAIVLSAFQLVAQGDAPVNLLEKLTHS